VTYLIIGGLFCMNLFVGFVVDGFNNSRGPQTLALTVLAVALPVLLVALTGVFMP